MTVSHAPQANATDLLEAAELAVKAFRRRARAEYLSAEGELLSLMGEHFNPPSEFDDPEREIDTRATLISWILEIYDLDVSEVTQLRNIVEEAFEAAREWMKDEKIETREVSDGQGGVSLEQVKVRVDRHTYQHWLLWHGARQCRQVIIKHFGEPEFADASVIGNFFQQISSLAEVPVPDRVQAVFEKVGLQSVDLFERRVLALANEAFSKTFPQLAS